MNEETTLIRKSKYDLTSPAMLKVPSSMYYILRSMAHKQNLHWSELARDILSKKIKEAVTE